MTVIKVESYKNHVDLQELGFSNYRRETQKLRFDNVYGKYGFPRWPERSRLVNTKSN